MIVRMGELAGADRIGGKAAALARLSLAGFPVPEWFALTPEACGASAESIRPKIDEALQRLGPGPYAVRSSAIDEDGRGHSFAGQLESHLFVPAGEVLERIAEVWKSGFSERVLAYRREHGLGEAPGAPAVLIQRMIDAAAAGVAFSADPVSGARGTRVVSAVRGVGEKLVSGDVDADTWRISRDDQIIEVLKAGDEACLTSEQALHVARLAARAEAHFGAPQDIEWAIKDGQLYLLQSRPITSLQGLADPDGERIVWDNSNIAESYSGVTTPLTFSFARRAYEEVYRQFCLILAVPGDQVTANGRTFRNMLGLIRGRVYYNLNSWYRTLALLPGFTLNRHFMEQMMGVREPMPEELVAELAAAGTARRLADAWNVARMLASLLASHAGIERRIRDFYLRLAEALAEPVPPLGELRLDELASAYRDLERRLLTRWDAPLVNDFLAMIFYGLLRKLAQRWCGDADGTLQNDLLCGEGGMISAEPATRVERLAALARPHPELIDALEKGTAFSSLSSEFTAAYEEYLARFGDRCMEELKLESATLHDDPATLLNAIAQLARRPQRASQNIEASLRAAAQARVALALAGKPLRRALFGWVLTNARERVRDRENLRFERTRLFGRVRRIFVEIGRRFAANGALEAPRDIFHLEVEEILGYIEGTATSTDLAALAEARKREFERYRAMPAPADRFESRGAVHQGNDFAGKPEAAVAAGDSVKGIGCCPGVVRAQVRVVRDPRDAALQHGEILVAERTDPGWIMLFPVCSGLLVERGSLLSHSAIVAREMGIPAIVSIPGVMAWARDGDWVEMNGATGVARKVAGPAAAA